MADKIFPQSGLPIRKTVSLLPTIFQTPANDKFMSAVIDPLVQPGVLQKLVGYIGRRYGKTYKGADAYLDNDNTLRSRYQLEPGVLIKDDDGNVKKFYDYLDFKNQLKFFGNNVERDDLLTAQEHYSWNPPKHCDPFVNYREYYWVPEGPPSVAVSGALGTKVPATAIVAKSVYRIVSLGTTDFTKIGASSNTVGEEFIATKAGTGTGEAAYITVSEYSVKLGTTNNSFIFTPDGLTNNPTLTLYRGRSYRFKVNAPGEGFAIRTNYDSGSLLYNPLRTYVKGQLTVYDDKLWRAKRFFPPGDGSTIDFDSQDWEFVETIFNTSVYDYNDGVTNNGVENGYLTFTVPFDAPDTLFYQGLITPDCFGRFVIANIESNTSIDVEKEIIGKAQYTSSNGVKFTSGLIVEFTGNVTPEKYSTGRWLVEAVGVAITLTNFQDLIVPKLPLSSAPEVLFDNEGFDTQPFDDATSFPADKDYVVISRDSLDSNPWSRYNRWFHREVLEYAYQSRGQVFPAPEESRAKRPIIEFLPNLKLFNHGAFAKAPVDYIDDFTSDIFSKIEGSTGYSVDGENLVEGSRVLVVADTDPLANNKIYKVQFILHNGRRQLHLALADDAESILDECVLVRRGKNNAGKMFHFNGTNWVPSQEKTKVNQPPKFDVFDSDGISFADRDVYLDSTFAGCNILSYKIGNGVNDIELGFPISYLNIANIGDVQFNFEWDTDEFTYAQNNQVITKKVSTGFYKFSNSGEFGNSWIRTTDTFIQPILDSVIVAESTDSISFTTIDWNLITSEDQYVVKFYLNGDPYTRNWTRTNNIFTFEDTFKTNDVVSLKLIVNLEPDTGYYQIPVGLEKNPLNAPLSVWTLGQAVDHLNAALDFNSSFVGTIPGPTNLRDIPINEFGQPYNTNGTRYMRHSGLTPMAISLLCDKTTNIIKSIQFAKRSYTSFKNNFLEKAMMLPFNDSIVDFVDDIIADLTKTKTSDSTFADSDMLGSGAYTAINYTVEDEGITVFALSEKFNLNEPSRRAVYVYVNGQQLLNTKDYVFDSTFGFVRIIKGVSEGDEIEIREYISSATNYVPPTPSSMGLYKKYTPMKFVDDTYREPKEVIQGHDGSITIAYGDFRDDLLLELEYRIYNNIKQEYDPTVFDIDSKIKGYYGVGEYTKSEIDSIVNQEFLKWIQNTNINYTLNEWFKENETFTYTYSNMTDPTGQINLPGYWRGVYQWFYDTDRPHRCPWEMLGFSEQPDWWEEEYGAAPYTSNNLILWEDLRDGKIAQGERAGYHKRYARPSLMDHIPVDGDGNLLSPLDSNLAGNFTLVNNRGPFVLGDINPTEYAWRSSSEWPFAMMIAMCLLKPFEFITDSFDRSRTKINILGQTVHKNTDTFITLDDIVIPSVTGEIAVGLVKYLIDYTKSIGISSSDLTKQLKNMDVQLSSRLSGFVDKSKHRYLLDSKSPASSSSGVFVPPENYDIIFNVSSPISSVAYSGVIIEKTEGGWILTGYDDINPYFNYFSPQVKQGDPLISVGGVSENFVDWIPNKAFSNGQLVRYRDKYYRALQSHTSGTDFDLNFWKQIAKVPMVGAVEAFRRQTFNTLTLKKLSYGTKLTSIQAVVDFLLGYEQYLISIGFVFNDYDSEIQSAKDWTTSCKEFMFWTRHNWAIGSLITLSPIAEKLNITVPVGIADSILDGFYDYQVLKGDGKPLAPQFINVNRDFQNIIVETSNTSEGIYFLKLYYVLKEHVTVFDDRTVFNDIIYDKPTGYRQDRIKTQGFRTTDWDGDYTSPGFLFDNVNIQVWQPFTDYKLGDIVAYRSYNWTSLTNQLGTEEFDDSKWSKLDSTPEKRLVANFDYRINQIEDYYDITSDGIGETETALARHAVGYQTREYLQNLAEDPVTQFQLYQGFIREKGTNNSLTKVFEKLSRSASSESITLNEEWAFRVGRYGGLDQIVEYEFELNKDKFQLNPQPIILSNTNGVVTSDQYYRINKGNFITAPNLFELNINPTKDSTDIIKTAGYVNANDVDVTVATRDDILELDTTSMNDNTHFWITFEGFKWTVLRLNENTSLYVVDVAKVATKVTLTLNTTHSIAVGDIFGVKNITNLEGFFKVTEVTPNTISIAVSASLEDPELTDQISNLYLFTTARFKSYSDLDTSAVAMYKSNSKLWIDNNGNDQWEVIEKQKRYSSTELTAAEIAEFKTIGTAVVYSTRYNQTIVSDPVSNYLVAYTEVNGQIKFKQKIVPPIEFTNDLNDSFGMKLALSPDNRYLVVSSPMATEISSHYIGEYNTSTSYQVDDIVLADGRLWRCISDTVGDGSTIGVYSQDWEPATIIQATTVGSGEGFTNQGMVTIYEYANQQWELRTSFISPRPDVNELFGSAINIGHSGSTYYLAVSAPGSSNNRGRVYLFVNDPESTVGWKHLENTNYSTFYQGIYADSTLYPAGATYPAGSVVWYDGALWQAQVDITLTGDDSTIGITGETSTDWKQIDPISTQNSLPTNVALYNNGSTLEIGTLSPNQLAELIKEGDGFGTSMSMSRDGSIIVIGAPYGDGQYFANYRGIWNPGSTYLAGDVVKFSSGDPLEEISYSYYKLVDERIDIPLGDSTILSSQGEIPTDENSWVLQNVEITQPLGKAFVYQRSEFGVYELKQTITGLEALKGFDDSTNINSGDQFGYSVDVDSTATTLVISSPRSDLIGQNEGAVFVFRTDGFAELNYKLVQILQSYEEYSEEYFGQTLQINDDASRIFVGATNATFVDANGTERFTGAVYAFEKKDTVYLLAEKLEAELATSESFGYSIDSSTDLVVVGSPTYKETGIFRIFKKSSGINSWNTIARKEPTVDLSKIKSISLYDNQNNVKIQDVDYVDHAKYKILNLAEQELKFKTPYDPAVYAIGTDEQVVEPRQAWAEKQVGQLWWNTSTAKWLDYEQSDTAYRAGNWNRLAEGSSIDVYEWVETPLLPSEWSALADTNEGLAEGISGQPLYPNDDVYGVKVLFNPATGISTGTLYYYWVKDKRTVPQNMPNRRIPSSSVASLISSPAGSGIAFIALIAEDKFLAYNFKSVINTDIASLNIQYYKNTDAVNPIHNEYQLLTEGVADSVPAAKLEEKWIDSLVGVDKAGNFIPDPSLAAKNRYGINIRPRQSMFVDRISILKIVIDYINNVLMKEAFADVVDYTTLNLVDTAPVLELALYDTVVDNETELPFVGTTRIRPAKLEANVINGEIDSITIVDSGFGYKTAPAIVIGGTGSGAKAVATLDSQGSIRTVRIVNKGKRYQEAPISVRSFSVLVNSDSTINNFWSIYAWDEVRKVFTRTQSQTFNTTKYWSLVDWWKEGYSPASRIVKEVLNLSEIPAITVNIGDLVRVKEYANGGWAVFETIGIGQSLFSDNYLLVGREKGTLEISAEFYKKPLGYDNKNSFDVDSYDPGTAIELRNILKAVKEDIFIGDYAAEWNKLFFVCIRYIFAEQQYVDWAFKTSFLNAVHNIGPFDQRTSYKSDNLDSFREYINEVKPYRTTVREYVSRYDTLEQSGMAVTDFDSPATYSVTEGKIVTVDQFSSNVNEFPWKSWIDNNSYSITAIEVYDGGVGYTTPPNVVISGDGTGAKAKAYISNGRVSGIVVEESGEGYTFAPTVSLVGGNPVGSTPAKAVAIIGNPKVRSISVGIKFDRISKDGTYRESIQNDEFIASGFTSIFELKYAPTRDKSKIKIYKNDRLVYKSEYEISLYKSTTDTYGLLKGKLIFKTAPFAGDVIKAVYEKNDVLLDAVDRISKYYSPTAGMKGKELNQLMTGIDFGGVQIQGTTFDVTGGWDALPWFTDNWDSVESSSDFYVVCDGSTFDVTLPFVPADGQQITIYLKRAGTRTSTDISTNELTGEVTYQQGTSAPQAVRIDDPNWEETLDSTYKTNPNAQMPTFIGDGSTNVINIGGYVSTEAGDTLIFRTVDSDGSVIIKDSNLLDTEISGGNLTSNTTNVQVAPNTINGAYSTARGVTAEEIVIDGDKFISPDQVPAPEENIPGQVLESVSIKVYTATNNTAVPLQTNTVVADGSTRVFDIKLSTPESNSVLVYVDRVKKEPGFGANNYVVDAIANTIILGSIPSAGSVVEIVAIGAGGLKLIDYQEFIGDGTTTLFLTAANFADTASTFVSLNGEFVRIEPVNSTGVVDTEDKVLIPFGIAPAVGDVIKIICLGTNSIADASQLPLVRVNRQRFEYEGSTRSFELADYIPTGRSSAVSSVIVEVNGRVLRGVDTILAVYDGIKNTFTIATDPEEESGTTLITNVLVYVNNELKTYIIDYVYDTITKVVRIRQNILKVGDVIRIENNLRAEYSIVGKTLIIDPTFEFSNTDETNNDNIDITWFNEYPSMGLISDEYAGGKVHYPLPIKPLGASYVWVYKTSFDSNGKPVDSVRLTKDVDYTVSPAGAVHLTTSSISTDIIKIISFGNKVYKEPSAFEIHKDMLNIYRFNRYSTGEITLVNPLNYYDTAMTVTDASNLPIPYASRNVPGIVSINGERIEYLQKSGNVLSQLRRGVHGTPIAELHSAGSRVADVSAQEALPYSETQDRTDFVSDGSTNLVGTLDFVPAKSTRPGIWFRSTIPAEYGPCDTIEVFAAGRRLRKDPITVYDETLGASSPAADIQIEAEFAVDGSTNSIYLTEIPPAGTRITVIRKTGKVWYDRGATTATSGVTLLDNSTVIAEFIAKRTTKLPE